MERKHYLDACRATLMFLGIPYHAALVYDVRRAWHVASPSVSGVLSSLDQLLGLFRMPAFFLVAGYFSVEVIRRTDAATWFLNRCVRLGVPLVAGAIVLSPAQLFLQDLGRSPSAPDRIRHAFSASLDQLLSPGPHWLFHLWFLVDLLALCAAFAFAWRCARGGRLAGAAKAVAVHAARHPRVSALASIPLLAASKVAILGSSKLLGEYRLAWLGILDLHRALSYAPYFALGVLLASSAAALRAFTSASRGSALAAAASAAGCVLARDLGGRAGWVSVEILSAAASVLMSHVLFSAAHRWLDRPDRVTRMLVDSSYTVYLVHQPIIMALALVLLLVPFHPLAEFAVIVAVTTALALAAHRAIRGSPILLLLFNGVRPRRAPSVETHRRTAAPASPMP